MNPIVNRFDRFMLLIRNNLPSSVILLLELCLMALWAVWKKTHNQDVILVVFSLLILLWIVVIHYYMWWANRFQYRATAIIDSPPPLELELQNKIDYWVRNYNSGMGLDTIDNRAVKNIWDGKPLNRKECNRIVEVINIYKNMNFEENCDKSINVFEPLCGVLIGLSKKLEIQDLVLMKRVHFLIANTQMANEMDFLGRQLSLAKWNVAATALAAISAVFSATAAMLIGK